jgi:hypothetical protein
MLLHRLRFRQLILVLLLQTQLLVLPVTTMRRRLPLIRLVHRLQLWPLPKPQLKRLPWFQPLPLPLVLPLRQLPLELPLVQPLALPVLVPPRVQVLVVVLQVRAVVREPHRPVLPVVQLPPRRVVPAQAAQVLVAVRVVLVAVKASKAMAETFKRSMSNTMNTKLKMSVGATSSPCSTSRLCD